MGSCLQRGSRESGWVCRQGWECCRALRQENGPGRISEHHQRLGELPSRRVSPAEEGQSEALEQPRAWQTRQAAPAPSPRRRTCRMGSGTRKRQQALTRRTAVPRLTRWPTDTYRGLELLLQLRSTWAVRKDRSGTEEAHLNTHRGAVELGASQSPRVGWWLCVWSSQPSSTPSPSQCLLQGVSVPRGPSPGTRGCSGMQELCQPRLTAHTGSVSQLPVPALL